MCEKASVGQGRSVVAAETDCVREYVYKRVEDSTDRGQLTRYN